MLLLPRCVGRWPQVMWPLLWSLRCLWHGPLYPNSSIDVTQQGRSLPRAASLSFSGHSSLLLVVCLLRAPRLPSSWPEARVPRTHLYVRCTCTTEHHRAGHSGLPAVRRWLWLALASGPLDVILLIWLLSSFSHADPGWSSWHRSSSIPYGLLNSSAHTTTRTLSRA